MEEREKKCYLASWDGQEGAERNPTGYMRRDDGSHIFHNTEHYYEWWYFDTSFDNGYHMVITFHYRNVFLKPIIPSLQFFIYKPDGTRVDRYAICDPAKISAHPDYCDVRMDESWVKDKGDQYELYIHIKDSGAHLTFKNIVPPWKCGNGFNYKDEESGIVAGWVVPVPNARVEGEITVKGETMAVSGSGYHDHNWGNYHFYNIYRRWYWGRIHSEKFSIDYATVLPRDEEAPLFNPLLLARENEIVLSANCLGVDLRDIEKDEKLGQEYARTLLLGIDALGVKLDLQINVQRLIESMQLPQVADWNHYYYRFIADYEMDVVIDGAAERVTGELLQELMIL